MSFTGLESIDTSVHKTNEWLRDVGKQLGDEDRRHAYIALRATLHALRDRLSPEQSAHLAAQLPLVVRGLYFENWSPAGTPVKMRNVDDFLETVHLGLADTHPDLCGRFEDVTRVVLRVLAKHLDAGTVRKTRDALPKALRTLWPEEA